MPEFLLLASDRKHPDQPLLNVVVPYVNQDSDPFIHKAMRLNLEMQAIRPRYESMEATHEFAYDRLFRRLWAERRPFVLVEHDILPWPGSLARMAACPEPWCAHQYLIFGELRCQLGCVKFEPQRLGPCPLPPEPIPWTRLDWAVITGLVEAGHAGHLHVPPVSHLNWAHQRMTNNLVLREFEPA